MFKWLIKIRWFSRLFGIVIRRRNTAAIAIPVEYTENHFDIHGKSKLYRVLPISRKTDTRPIYQVKLKTRALGPPDIFNYVLEIIKTS